LTVIYIRVEEEECWGNEKKEKGKTEDKRGKDLYFCDVTIFCISHPIVFQVKANREKGKTKRKSVKRETERDEENIDTVVFVTTTTNSEILIPLHFPSHLE
jgi:hypothetical protein